MSYHDANEIYERYRWMFQDNREIVLNAEDHSKAGLVYREIADQAYAVNDVHYKEVVLAGGGPSVVIRYSLNRYQEIEDITYVYSDWEGTEEIQIAESDFDLFKWLFRIWMSN
jgi:hypothetical protein